ncbi:hypothetical protein P389DRAFT_110169 [Cystobasidium minutum MCA 4210]|uniref:uncharacterized protein n=1 Tax=Cystobasidium minutum MCA 4210 TaxID=1397322 RepID=UPI0034CF7C27|eukprot:jgi/Rhomi1/110169/CE110168_666
MEEDAPPVDTLDDFDNDAGVPYVSSPPPSQPAPISASPAKRQIGLPNGSASQSASSSSFGQMSNGQSSNNNSSSGIYKVVVFGYPPNLQSSVLKEFASIAPLVYNSIQDPSPSTSSSNKQSDVPPPTGSNWFTIGYDNDWAALRAIRKNGDIIADSAMIGVKWADPNKALDSGMDLIPSSFSSQQQQSSASSNGLPRSSTASNLGTPATILPASQAFLPNKASDANSSGAAAMRKSATLNKINEMGKIDPSIFKQPEASQQQKQGGGVVGTLTNLIFGF